MRFRLYINGEWYMSSDSEAEINEWANKFWTIDADDHWIPKTVFPADWGKSAGYRRNEQMAQYAEVLVAFWDYNSPGTRHMINLAKQYNLEVYVIDTRKEM